jgi:hypothetical protein
MKGFPGLILSILGCLLISASSVSAEAPKIGKNSEWKATKETIQAIRKECADNQAPDFGKCFVDSMGRSGASPQAVAFAKSTYNTGYLAHFFKKGRVDLAYVIYPFRANENQGWMLVNGDPPMINVDALTNTNLPERQLEQNPAYRRIKKKYPKVMLFGGDRTLEDPPEMQFHVRVILPFGGPGISWNEISRSPKGQRFVVTYRLLNGCHACERLGQARFEFRFDAEGKLLGTALLDVK